MARTVGSSGPKTAQSIREAGLRLIYEHGYEAMSLRQLGQEVGLQSGSLYNHIASKQALLFEIVLAHMEDLTAHAQAALAGLTDPVDRLRAFCRLHLAYHMTRRAEVVVANMELRSLEPENRARIVALRDGYEARLSAILADGKAAGVFRVEDVRVTTFALIAMLTGISQWYRPDGRLGQEDLIRIHTGLVLEGVKT
ncbi:TetR/AcrR family transcriptional regulator [Prosthecomicrobium sp. N25]|uniref:TetR/AcrR family transcriptional regulator n=1 Tax=Prosthecomicrobium sp. N25 TaxID=3129254 RepID=UPI0030775F48